MNPNTTAQTLELLKAAQKSPISVAEKAGITQALGLVAYDLEAGAKLLFPVITPLRNRIPREGGGIGTAVHWKAVLGINTQNFGAGVEEGKRSRVISISEQDRVAAYAGIGLENNVSFEAQYAGRTFEDARALAVQTGLWSLMIQEELLILGGFSGASGLLLGITPTPVATLSATGTMTTGSTKVFCVALTMTALLNIGVGVVGAGAVLQGPTVTYNNADGTTTTTGAGTAQVSAGSNTVTVANGVTAHVAAVKGAAGYAWFCVGGNTAAATALLAAVTTINSVALTADGVGASNAATFASDGSADTTVYDGIITQALAGTGLYATQATGTDGVGTPLTSDGGTGIVEIDADLKAFWDNRRLSPSRILLSSQEVGNINKKVVNNGGAPLIRYTMDAGGGHLDLTASQAVGNYLNKYAMSGGQLVKLELHPNMPAGTILYMTERLPYPLPRVTNILQMKTRQEYYQIEWPLRTRLYEYGVYADEVLQMYAPFAFGVRTNIGNG